MPQWLDDAKSEYVVFVARGAAALTLALVALGAGVGLALLLGPELAERFWSCSQ